MSQTDDVLPDDWSDIGSPGSVRVYWAGELELLNATESTTGGRKVKFKLVRNPAEQATINPFAAATLRRNKHAGTRFRLSATPLGGASDGPDDQTLGMEVMLLAWADNPQGSTVTLLLDQEGDHPFMPLAAGDRFMAAFVEIGDDDQAVDESAHRRSEAASPRDFDTGMMTAVVRETHHQTLSNQAAILCKSADFKKWMVEASHAMYGATTEAAVRLYCGIGSRSELDSVPAAAAKFVELRAAFNSRSTHTS
jgi:hypothetical protein